MSTRRVFTRRSLTALVPLALVASLLSTDALSGQNGTVEAPAINVVAAPISPTANVTVLGDGLLAAPYLAPVRPGRCKTSMDGPVERAARRSPNTIVAVQNESCVGASLLSIGQEQVGKINPDSDLVVIGGIGLEFDWPTLAASCLGRETRSATGCQAEASSARANAANSFFSWRSLVRQTHRGAPDATIVIVSPPLPVTNTPLPLGSMCCEPSADGHEQVRAVFETASSLRRAVVESVVDLPIVVVESTDAFDGHRIDDPSPWLVDSADALGTPTALGADAIADLLDVLMPIGVTPEIPAKAPLEIVLVLGTTTADQPSHIALRNAAPTWFQGFDRSGVRPSVALVPISTSDPVPPDDDPPVGDDSSVVEIPLEEPDDDPPVGDDSSVVEIPIEVPDVEASGGSALVALQIDVAPPYATTADEFVAGIEQLSTSAGVTSVGDLSTALSQAVDLLGPTIKGREVIVRVATLDLANAPAAHVETLRTLVAELPATVTIIAPNVDVGASLSILLRGTGAVIDAATDEQLGATLPVPEPAPVLLGVIAADSEAALSQAVNVSAQVLVSQPISATVAWYSGDTVIAAGQQTSIDPVLLGVGAHEISVVVATDLEEVRTTMQLRISADGDGQPDDACGTTFDPFPSDSDDDGLPNACDDDDDDDGLADAVDPCPTVYTDNLGDIDLDGRPDHCDADSADGPRADADGDGFPDLIDNCPATSQIDQFDADYDGVGNACETNVNRACTITGTPEGDTLRGTTGPDVICGLGGDDIISGFGGDDIIFAGPGNDKVFGGNGNDRILGGSGRDEIHGQGGSDLLIGEAGDDVLRGGFGADIVSGGRGADDVDGAAGPDIIFGGRGADTLRGGDGDDVITGEGGNDAVFGENGNDLLTGGPGQDSVRAGRGHDQLVDVQDIDFVRGGTGIDLIDSTPLRVT